MDKSPTIELSNCSTGQRRAVRLAVYFFFFAAAALRLADLGGKSFWVDEAKWYAANRTPVRQIVERCRVRHYPPGRELLLHAMDGERGGRFNREALQRLPSALAGAMFAPLIFLLVRRLAGMQAGLLAGLFVTAHPWHLQHSQDARMHAVFLTCATLASLALATAAFPMRRAGPREESPEAGARVWWTAWALWGAALALYAWFTYMAALAFIAFTVFIGVWTLSLLARGRWRPARRVLAGVGVGAAVFLILYAAWIPTAAASGALFGIGEEESVAAAPPPGPAPRGTPYEPDLNGRYWVQLQSMLSGRTAAGAAWGALLALAGTAALVRRRRLALVFCAGWLIAPAPVLLFSEAGHFFPQRYLFVLLLPWACLAGAGGAALIAETTRRFGGAGPLRRRALQTAAWIVVGGGILASQAPGVVRYYASEKQDWRGAVEYLSKQADAESDLVMAGDHWAIYGLLAYAEPDRLRVYIPDNLSAEAFLRTLNHPQTRWYVHWAELPGWIKDPLHEKMEVVKTLPGTLGDVIVWRRKD